MPGQMLRFVWGELDDSALNGSPDDRRAQRGRSTGWRGPFQERLVVAGALDRVVEDCVSACEFSKPLGPVRARVQIGVVLACEPSIGPANLAYGRVVADAQQRVVVDAAHH
jgi:hypothetical protein